MPQDSQTLTTDYFGLRPRYNEVDVAHRSYELFMNKSSGKSNYFSSQSFQKQKDEMVNHAWERFKSNQSPVKPQPKPSFSVPHGYIQTVEHGVNKLVPGVGAYLVPKIAAID